MHIVLIGVIALVCLVFSDTYYACKKAELSLPAIVYVLLGVGVLVLLYVLVYCLEPHLRRLKYRRVYVVAASLAMFGMLVMLSCHYYFTSGWDVGIVYDAACAIAEGDEAGLSHYYMSVQPNNIFISYIFSVLIKMAKVFGIMDYYIVLVVAQCFVFALGGFLLWEAGNCLYGGRTATWSWLIYAGLVGLSPWVVVPYTDSMGLIFPIGQIYLWTRILKRRARRSFSFFLLGVLTYVGMQMKMQSVIVGIAGCIVLALLYMRSQEHKRIRGYVGSAISFVGGVVVAVVVVSLCISSTGLQIDKGLSKTPTHYLMMGLNEDTNGVFSEEDCNFSLGYRDKTERTIAELKVIKRRVTDMGVTGLVDLWTKKILTNYNDGSFAWWVEGSFYTEAGAEKDNTLALFLQNFYYKDGKYHVYFINGVHVLWMGVLALNLLAVFEKRKDAAIYISFLALIGIALFELLFEARARYIFTYVPIYILMACGNAEQVLERIQGLCQKRNVRG
ncbi:MAG: hypothetical protein E7286_01665 [Lachnospiraceae bacterium]|nr:hypothetical protein [Lachnospiraceae bacterium]